VAGGKAFAAVRFPREAEPGERWAEKMWIAAPWMFRSGPFGVEVVFEDARFTAVPCLQHGEGLAGVDEVHVCASQFLNIKPSIHAVATGHVPRRSSTQAPATSA
jgi:hypothetical protein